MGLLQNLPEMTTDFSEHVDIRLLETQQKINRANRKMMNSGYIPALALTGQYSVQGLRKEFKNYFSESPENKWYGTSYIGIPVFDGFKKRSKSRQAKMEIQKTEALLFNQKEKFTADYQNAVIIIITTKRTWGGKNKTSNLQKKSMTKPL